MAEPLGRAETRDILDRHGIRLRKDLGQHFLVEPNVVRRIVELSMVGPSSQVVEIGAGAGTLTRALAATGASVLAYEVDDRLAPVLAETVGAAAEVRIADAASIDFADALGPGEWVVVANLPYNVGTPIVLDILQHVPRVIRLIVMLQREAVERLAAGPGTKAYGVPSVIAALHARVDIVLRVPAHLFVPQPKVESAVASLTRIEADVDAPRAIALAAAGFGQRRKMLRTSLRADLGDDVAAILQGAGIDPTSRAEDLAPPAWLDLARAA